MSDAEFDDDNDDWEDDPEGDDWDDDPNADDWDEPMDDNEEEDLGGSWEIQVENLYYTAEPDIKADPASAMDNFLKCIALEEENSPDKVNFRFKALKNVVLLLFNAGIEKKDQMIEQYRKMLAISNLVSPNDLNSAIRSILNKIQENTDISATEEMYSMTLVFILLISPNDSLRHTHTVH